MKKNNKKIKNAEIGKIDYKALEIKDPIKDIDFFIRFCSSDIESAIEELGAIQNDMNRKHLQRLVYVNLINRFDYLIDKLLLWFGVNNLKFRTEILKSLDEESITKKEVFEIFFLKEKSYDFIISKLRDVVRLRNLRERHSTKLHKITKILDFKNIEKPRVNNSDGKILSERTKHSSIPNSILGYADWLYCRRNSIVHGDGTNYTNQDLEHLKKNYTINVSKTFKLSLPSIKTAITFYKDLLNMIKDEILAQSYLNQGEKIFDYTDE